MRRGLLIGFPAVLLATACGSRTDLDLGVPPVSPGDAGLDAPADVAPMPDAGLDAEAGPMPFILASGRNTPSGIAVTATDVYWCDYGNGNGDGYVMTTPIGGGTVRSLASKENPWALTIHAGVLYWTSYGSSGSDGTIESLRLGGSGLASQILAVSQSQPWGIVADDTRVYWTQRMAGVVSSTLLTNIGGLTPPDTVAGNLDTPAELAEYGGNLYWTSYMAQEGVFRVASGGGPISALVTGQNFPDHIVVDATDIFYATRDGIMRLPRAGGMPVQLAPSANHIVGIASDGVNVYWTDYGANTVSSVSVNGGAVSTLATGQNGAFAIAVDDKNLYWTTYLDGNVMQLAK